MRFVISATCRGDMPRCNGSYRAFIYSQEGDEEEVERSFSQTELVAEIARLTAQGQSTAYYARALQCLQLLNGPTTHLPGVDALTASRPERAMQAHSS